MDTIEALRERADLARRQLSDQGGQRLQLFERLSERINAVADELRDKGETIVAYEDRVGQLGSENDQLREILRSLLLAIEADANHGLSPALRSLEAKVSTMVDAEGADDVIVMAAVEPEPVVDPMSDFGLENEPDDDLLDMVTDPVDAMTDDDGWSENETPMCDATEAVEFVDAGSDLPDHDDGAIVLGDADGSVIDNRLDDAMVAADSDDDEQSDAVSQLNAIGDIVQRLMKEMSDDDEIAEAEAIDEPEVKAS
jgi:hypothetical protein